MLSPQPRVATLVLCTPEGAVLGQLPPFSAAVPWWQDAAALVRGARDRYGVEVVVLRLLSAALPGPPGGAVTYLAQVAADAAPALPLQPWGGSLEDHPLRAAYALPGGPDRDLAWAEGELQRLGRRLTGAAEQVRTWNLSSLWRLPATGGAVWLKHVPPFFAHEGGVLRRLQDDPERLVPRLLAHEGGRVLLEEVPGTDRYDAPPGALLAMVSVLVHLQARWAARQEELLALGLPDWRAEPLAEAVAAVVARAGAQLRRHDLRTVLELVDALPARFAAVAACGLPDTLVHGDFAPGNWRGDEDRMVLLDWADSGVGHPLLDRAAFLDRITAEAVPTVLSRWDRAWQAAAPGSDPARAAALLAPVAAARQAVIYQRFLDGIEPSEHPYHRDDPRLWLTRAAELARARPRAAQLPAS